MNNKSILIILFCVVVIESQVLLQNELLDDSDYYQIKHLKSIGLKPLIQYVDSLNLNEVSDKFVYQVALHKEKTQKEQPMNDHSQNNLKEFFMIKSKLTSVDIGPYDLIQKLDQIKYMIVWLNLYCGEHPDCDKIKLNNELQKMVSSVAAQNNNIAQIK